MVPNISQLRLQNQQIAGTEFKSVKELVHWMGAIQAQDYAMAKYAIGIRLKNAIDQTVEDALNKADIIRSHVLRPTWHFVHAKDIRWMLELTSQNLNRSMSSNYKRLELDGKTFNKANSIIEKLLRDGNQLTRKEIMTALEQKGIRTNELRAIHIMFKAETDLVVCNGIKKDKQFTYALLDERVPWTRKISKEQALAKLAERYFLSHGPATIQDFSWWSGLSVADAKNAVESIKSNLISEKLNDHTFWFSNKSINVNPKTNTLFFLPSYDEFLISYKSRWISMDPKFSSNTFTTNGIFNPIIVYNAKVIGTWKPQLKKNIFIKEYFFAPPTQRQKQLSSKAAKEFGRFMQKKITKR